MPDSWNASLYDDKHAFVWQKAADLIDLLAPIAGERILDLGCGTGHLTSQLAERGAEVVGLDHSTEMIEQARAHYPHLTFVQGDARDFTIDGKFDAVFSNAALHWVREADRVLANVGRILKPGGRFVAEFGGQGNVGRIVAAATDTLRQMGLPQADDPWYFPSIGQYAGLLEAARFEVRSAVLFDRPTPLEGDLGLRHWLAMFGQHWLTRVPASRRDDYFGQVEACLKPILRDQGRWLADYRRLRVLAIRREE